jgi:hypothetical protein
MQGTNEISLSTLEKRLRNALKSVAPKLAELSPHGALQTFVELWQSTSINDCGPAADDGLIVNFDLLSLRGRTLYTLSLIRVIARAPDPDCREYWRPATRLQLQLGAVPSLEVLQLEPGIATFDCLDKTASSSLIESVAASKQFQALACLTTTRALVSMDEVAAPTFHWVHPTKGVSWAL